MDLKEKVVVITGSTGGIGKAAALACARAGTSVVLSSRRENAVKSALKEFQAKGYSAIGIVADVGIEADLIRLKDEAIAAFGNIDVWVNNAGTSGGYRPLHTIPSDEIQTVVQTNLVGTLLACRMMLPYFCERGGIIINLSGKGGNGNASAFTATYAATKAAIVSLTKSLAQEYKDFPVSIHAISPGMVQTDFYTDIKTSPEAASKLESLPLVFKAIGVEASKAGELIAAIASQKPGEITGKTYSALRGRTLATGMIKLMYYRMTRQM